MRLKKIQCDSAKPDNKPYKLSDGGGLHMLVHPNGSKYWRLKYRFLGKEKQLALGSFPGVSLAQARDAREDAKKLLRDGIDPNVQKQKIRHGALLNASNTFEKVAREWHHMKEDGWTTSYANHVLHRLEADIFPAIGKLPIADIDAPTLLQAVKKIEKRGATELANRCKQVCGQVFRYGIQTGRCKHNPAPDLNGALKTHKTKHFPSIKPEEIGELLEALHQNKARLYPRTMRAIELSMLTFVRPNELREATWQEINFQEALWTIPAERMKMRRDHIVPLSKQAIAVLRNQYEETGELNFDWVFPSIVKPRQPISNGTVNVALKKLGFHGRMTAHGFRALARTAIREKLKYDPDIIECQLAHKAAGPLGEAYNRSQFIDDRKQMMQEWADYIDGELYER